MEIFPPDLQSELFTTVEEFVVYQRDAAKSEEKSEEKKFFEKFLEDSKKKLKSLKNEIFTRYALRTSPSKTLNEQDADFRLRLEVFQKTRELLPLMEVLEAKDSRHEEREKALSRAREICDSLKEHVSPLPQDPPCFDPGPGKESQV
jgi:hypothetical protein